MEPETRFALTGLRRISSDSVECYGGQINTVRYPRSPFRVVLKSLTYLDSGLLSAYGFERYQCTVSKLTYAAGIGTDITPGSLAATTLKKSSPLGKSKTLGQALGASFDQHVLGGYRFLMRHSRSESGIYIFGFSRGAYTARFLAEMLDYVGLLGPDNEEMIPFIWDAFSQWKLSRYNETNEKKRAFEFLRHCRDTLCRPAQRVKFLGLFDTVNSVADFEINNDAVPSACVSRHCVAIDERRVKFQPVFLDGNPETKPQKLCRDDGQSPQSTEDAGDDIAVSDLQEVWFPGGHADIGGGFQRGPDENFQLSHAPLVWMVQEAQRAGLEFEEDKLRDFKCVDNTGDADSSSDFHTALRESSAKGLLHDRLSVSPGVSAPSVLAWNLMEHIPFRRLAYRADGSSKVVHWPLNRGRSRVLPSDALVHVSAMRRVEVDPDYRPGNLLTGKEGGLDEWVIHSHADDPVRQVHIRKRKGDVRTE